MCLLILVYFLVSIVVTPVFNLSKRTVVWLGVLGKILNDYPYKQVVLLIWLFGVSLYAQTVAQAGDLANPTQQWQRLLHIDASQITPELAQSSVERKSLVQDRSFFLTQQKANFEVDLEREWQAGIAALKTDLANQGSQSETDFICRFPYRSRFLAAQNAPVYTKLLQRQNQCQRVKDLIDAARRLTVGIVFIDEQPAIITNMMGHLALRFDFAKAISLDGKQFSDSWMLSFFTILSSQNPAKQLLNALGVGAEGRLKAYPAQYIERIYRQREQRSMWQGELLLSSEEKINLLLHLHELLDRPMQYSYMPYNCGTALVDLLHTVSQSQQQLYQSLQQYRWQTPLEFVQQMQRHDLVSDFSLLPSTADQIYINSQASQDFKGRSFLQKQKSSQWLIRGLWRDSSMASEALDVSANSGFQLGFLLAGSQLTDNHWHEFDESRLAIFDVKANVWYKDLAKVRTELQKVTLFGFDYRPVYRAVLPETRRWSVAAEVGWQRVQLQNQQRSIINQLAPQAKTSFGQQRQWGRWLAYAGLGLQYWYLGDQQALDSRHQMQGFSDLSLVYYPSSIDRLQWQWHYYRPLNDGSYDWHQGQFDYLRQISRNRAISLHFKTLKFSNPWQNSEQTYLGLGYRYNF